MIGLESHLFTEQDMERCAIVPVALGEAAVYSRRNPEKDTPNEDAALVIALPENRGILAVADGMGGLPSGGTASRVCLERFLAVAGDSLADEASVRDAILNGYEAANRSVADATGGGGTTLTVVELDGRNARTYHVGDSQALVVGQRARVKHVTTSHSPVGYGVEAGLLTEEEAFDHEDRHVISNMLGADDMRIEIGPRVRLARHDTVLLASDGLFDNLRLEEIVESVRKGALVGSIERLAEPARDRMTNGRDDADGKPDDLTVLVYRHTRDGFTTAVSVPR